MPPLIAPKIFSNDPESLQLEVLSLVTKGRGLEVAMYGYNTFNRDISNEIGKIDRKILHLWQKRVYLTGLLKFDRQVWNDLDFELNLAHSLGIYDAVIHLTASSSQLPTGTNPVVLANSLATIIKNTYSRGLKLYIENTFGTLEFYTSFYRTLHAQGAADKCGFCLDTGHVRVYNGSTLDQWLEFIKELKHMGFSQHYHIHVNDGTDDQHHTLSYGHTAGLLEPIEVWTPRGFMPWLRDAMAATPEAIFCMEHPAQQSKEAMAYLELIGL